MFFKWTKYSKFKRVLQKNVSSSLLNNILNIRRKYLCLFLKDFFEQDDISCKKVFLIKVLLHESQNFLYLEFLFSARKFK